MIGAGGGNDTIADFENGVDKIDVGTLATSFAGVTVTQDGSDAVVGFGAGSPTLRLQNTAAASVDASDFVFGTASTSGVELTWRDSTQPFFLIPAFNAFTTVTSATSTSFRWNSSDGSFWTITGSGFTYDGANRPSGGTVTAIDGTSSSGQPAMLLTGLSLSAAQLSSWVQANNGTAFLVDVLGGDDSLTGNAVFDYLSGGAGNDTLVGNGGDDNFSGGSGDDTIVGGAGNYDAVSYGEDSFDPTVQTQGVTVNLATGTATDNWGDTDTLSEIEVVGGSNLADSITLGTADGVALGGEGNDTLVGGSGNDALDGWTGNDTLNGGAGIDTALYQHATGPVTVDLAAGTASDGFGGRTR